MLPPGDFPFVSHLIPVPREIIARSGSVGDFNRVVVPIDPVRERNAKYRQYDIDQLCAEGAKVLRLFLSRMREEFGGGGTRS